MKNLHCNVSGLVSSESSTKVRNSLGKIEGVQKIAVDIGRGTIEVGYNEPASEETIKNCIEKTGYYVEQWS